MCGSRYTTYVCLVGLIVCPRRHFLFVGMVDCRGLFSYWAFRGSVQFCSLYFRRCLDAISKHVHIPMCIHIHISRSTYYSPDYTREPAIAFNKLGVPYLISSRYCLPHVENTLVLEMNLSAVLMVLSLLRRHLQKASSQPAATSCILIARFSVALFQL